jgi:hypothetical protein
MIVGLTMTYGTQKTEFGCKYQCDIDRLICLQIAESVLGQVGSGSAPERHLNFSDGLYLKK